MSTNLAWTALILAGLLDVAWAASMKLADGYSRPGWTLVSLILLASFVYLLGKTLTVLPVGTAYAVWTGIGAAGTLILGTVAFGETLGPAKLGGLVLIVVGIILVKAAGE